ncbi:hypothetical protein [Maridesulfovibrio sp.]|uniref:hypothetical protein n=1 Tax=Maridesulfovibrio sp. TaxID=2795000 RepID=UPI002A18CDB9|nr:hypothetical protein [Maridesulfovibrio sp.]
MNKFISAAVVIFILIPALALAWPGKIVAIDNADTFVVLKNGQEPVKVKLAGVSPAAGMTAAKSRLGSSNIVLMKDVDVRELSSSGDVVVADVTIDGKSLAKDLLDAGVVQSIAAAPDSPTAQEAATVDSSTALPDAATAPQNIPAEAEPQKETSADKIIAELDPPAAQPETVQTQPVVRRQQPQPAPVSRPVYRYAVQPAQPLGLWPARPAAAPVPAVSPGISSYGSGNPSASFASAPASAPASAQPSTAANEVAQTAGPAQSSDQMQVAGDIAKQDYELAVKVQQKTRIRKNGGFFVPKKKSQTFVGGGMGTQVKTEPSGNVPYSSFGAMGGVNVRHFYPSGFGIGGDFTMSRGSGTSGTVTDANATNGTAYDYKSKSFDTYTFTAALLYRFYSDSNWLPYVALHGGYSIFSYPDTVFSISDGAPVAGAGAGVLYEFDSGFTIGADLRYMQTFGTKSHDPSGFFDSTINFGYTFD